MATAYDACLSMIRSFRDKHIQMVSRYIIVKSREAKADMPLQKKEEADLVHRPRKLSQSKPGEKKDVRGTGGTALIPFLKQAREETGEPAIDAWTRRIMRGDRSVRLGKIGEHSSGEMETVGISGVWSVDEGDGGICRY